MERAAALDRVPGLVLELLGGDALDVDSRLLISLSLGQLLRPLLGLGHEVFALLLQRVYQVLHISQLDRFPQQNSGRRSAKLSGLHPRLDVLEILVEQVADEIELHRLQSSRLEVVLL